MNAPRYFAAILRLGRYRIGIAVAFRRAPVASPALVVL
jgi:hypothetical protein